MESFFFNITDTRYKITELFRDKKEYLKRVDISNGIVFFGSNLTHKRKKIKLKYLDRMIMIVMVKKGIFSINDYIGNKNITIKAGEIGIFCSSRQDLSLNIEKSEKSDIFILFIADFFLKRYLSGNIQEPIDFLYQKIQKEISLEHIHTQPIDALSIYIVEKILNIPQNDCMKSIRTEHRVTEFIIHHLSLLDIFTEEIEDEELELATKAKALLLQNFVNPPSIQTLSHLCATNEFKLKKAFKKVYKTTIYKYIQKLRLDEANILLKEENLTIGEIAKMVGYKHQGHFSKLFFSTYGIYPKDLTS